MERLTITRGQIFPNVATFRALFCRGHFMRVLVGLDFDDTVYSPQEAMHFVCTKVIFDAYKGRLSRQQCEAFASTWLNEIDSQWAGFGASARLNQKWGYSGHEAVFCPPTASWNHHVSASSQLDRLAVIDFAPDLSANAIIAAAALMATGDVLSNDIAEHLIGQSQELAQRIYEVRHDPNIDIPVFMPGTLQLLRALEAMKEVDVVLGTNGDFQVQMEKIEDANRRSDGLFNMAVRCSGHKSIDRGKPHPDMIELIAREADPSVDILLFAGNRRDTDVEATTSARDARGGRPEQGLTLIRRDLIIQPVWYDFNGRGTADLTTKDKRQLREDEVMTVTSHEQTLRVVTALVEEVPLQNLQETYSPTRARTPLTIGWSLSGSS